MGFGCEEARERREVMHGWVHRNGHGTRVNHFTRRDLSSKILDWLEHSVGFFSGSALLCYAMLFCFLITMNATYGTTTTKHGNATILETHLHFPLFFFILPKFLVDGHDGLSF